MEHAAAQHPYHICEAAHAEIGAGALAFACCQIEFVGEYTCMRSPRLAFWIHNTRMRACVCAELHSGLTPDRRISHALVLVVGCLLVSGNRIRIHIGACGPSSARMWGLLARIGARGLA
jgi:hypothetical protein